MPENRELSKQERSAPGVLVGVDGSEASLVAVDWAAHDAASSNRPLTVCYVSPGLDHLGMPVVPELVQEYADRSRDIIARAANRARDAEPELSVQTRLAYGQLLPSSATRRMRLLPWSWAGTESTAFVG